MTLPPEVQAGVEERFGRVRSLHPVGGGCINPSARVETEGGPIFLKFNSRLDAEAFQVEAEGLRALRAASAMLRVPEVLALGQGGGPGWLALEWLEPGRPATDFGRKLGAGLAAIHRAGAVGWGWERDGLIGSLAQENLPTDRWADFWRTRRLEPQLRLARDAGRLPATEREWERLLDRLPELLSPVEQDGPSLLHGDLWSGNVLVAAGGEPALVDPAVYRGHREVDIAMTELFGGFDADFYAAYEEAWPLLPGYRPVRRGVYQLFYLLVHVNLFGQGYVARTASTLRQLF